MAFETKEQVLEKILSQEKPRCPDCNKEMSLWEVPPITCGDGLGWDSPYLYVCFNDACPIYVSGWDNLMENYAHRASYRCIKSPFGNNFEVMPVFSSVGGSGQIIDDRVMAEQEVLKEAIKKGFSILADCYVSKDDLTVVRLLLDPFEPVRVRVKAAEMAGDLAGIEAIDLINNFKFENDLLQKNAKAAVEKIHERHFTRECPFCAEIIKKRASICKHCGLEVAGK
ncbi:MAG: zinc ribbon domain-containing protein [Desulfosalsimonadaceae bacterium]